MEQSNIYGDDLAIVNSTRGADISSQRRDDLDQAALTFVAGLSGAPQVLDLGCGRCSMSNAFAELNTTVVAVDLEDYSALAHQQVTYLQGHLTTFLKYQPSLYDVIFCQRTLHYLPYEQAVEVIKLMRSNLSARGYVFLSASGLNSELSQDYAVKDHNIQQRFDYLSFNMQEKHGIKEKVCLYSLEELQQLVTNSGLVLQDSWTSEFGNIKLIASLI